MCLIVEGILYWQYKACFRSVFPDNLITATFTQTETVYEMQACDLPLNDTDRPAVCDKPTKITSMMKGLSLTVLDHRS